MIISCETIWTIFSFHKLLNIEASSTQPTELLNSAYLWSQVAYKALYKLKLVLHIMNTVYPYVFLLLFCLCCQDAPHFDISGNLKNILKVSPENCLQYAVIEGNYPFNSFSVKSWSIFSCSFCFFTHFCLHVCMFIGIVQPIGEPLKSQFQNETVGVLQKFMLREHKLLWNGLSHTWWALD